MIPLFRTIWIFIKIIFFWIGVESWVSLIEEITVFISEKKLIKIMIIVSGIAKEEGSGKLELDLNDPIKEGKYNALLLLEEEAEELKDIQFFLK